MEQGRQQGGRRWVWTAFCRGRGAGEDASTTQVDTGDGCGLDRAMREVGDGIDMRAQAVCGREKGEGAAAVASSPEWVGALLGRAM